MTNNNEDSDRPDFCFPSSSIIPYRRQPHQQSQKPRKKRTKTIKINIDSQLINVPSSSTTCCSSSSTTTTTIGGLSSKPKCYGKKPDPLAPTITRPCTECGKKFWSWKALYGHMRCHPERQWRGINPPPNYRAPPTTSPVQQFTTTSTSTSVEAVMTAEDHDVAASLLLLANTTNSTPAAGETTALMETESGDYGGGGGGGDGGCADGIIISTSQVQQEAGGGGNCRFECSSCKKVFGSHQALGGHRASHKNVKGCFAITTRSSDGCEVIDRQDHSGGDHHVKVENHMEDNSTSVGNNKKMVNMVLGGGHHNHHQQQQHQCSICLRVFSSGQALGGHKRCHWEKVEEASSSINEGQGLLNVIAATNNSCGILDLNLPAPIVDQESSSSYSSSALTLDLRLCL